MLGGGKVIHVLKAGLLTTVQDLGRFGYQKDGVVACGAMDAIAHKTANWIVGNQANEATLEMTLSGPVIEFESDAVIAITGASIQPTIFGKKIDQHKPVYVRAGSILRCDYADYGCRAYLAIAGGFEVDRVMGSKSTYLRAKLGGWKGRALRKADQIPIGKETNQQLLVKQKLIHRLQSNADFSQANWSVPVWDYGINRKNITVRVTKGKQFDWFTETSRQQFTSLRYQITNESDRMGYRLQGTALQLKREQQLLSEATSVGTIQVPSNGKPICLMKDRQTTGGYPKIAEVITADIPCIAQAKPGMFLRFHFVSLNEAEQALLNQSQREEQLQLAIRWKREER